MAFKVGDLITLKDGGNKTLFEVTKVRNGDYVLRYSSGNKLSIISIKIEKTHTYTFSHEVIEKLFERYDYEFKNELKTIMKENI